jgi:aspartate kinase
MTPAMTPIVWKLGGSILRDLPSYRHCARRIADRLRGHRGSRMVAIVSARCGETDELLALATSLAGSPEESTLDLLWSTGEIRSAAMLAFCLHAAGVSAAALDAHQTGITCLDTLHVDPLPLCRALAVHDVVVVPGFLACGAGSKVITLGRGGSDLSAVAIATALGVGCCELIKDVPGYFAADPHRDAQAEHLAAVDYDRALRMARDGCSLVQPAALDLASRAGLTLIIRAFDDSRRTVVEGGVANGGEHEQLPLRRGVGGADGLEPAPVAVERPPVHQDLRRAVQSGRAAGG